VVAKVPPKDTDVKIKFGGGLHTRASTDEIDAREATDGQNFLLDLENRELRPRPPFDLIGTLPNAGSVLGGGSLLKADGTVVTIFQGAGIVYKWDGGTGFTQVGTCNSSSQLRGHWKSQNWTLADKLLLTDLTLNDVIKEFDGTTLSSVAFTDQSGAAFGTFYAKYLEVTNERAFFANVRDAGGLFPHLMVGSAQSVYTQITTTNLPSTALSTSDPFYLTSPDLKPVNGLVGAFGTRIISTEKGSLFNLSGESAKDFSFNEFFVGSGASGNESLTYTGNDIIYGRQGRIESVTDTSAFGNSEADDLSRQIADTISAYTGWRTVCNSRLNRVYCFPDNISEVWVFNTAMLTTRILSANALNKFVLQSQPQQEAGKLSPWMRWKTNHALDFKPTFVMEMLDPSDGLEYVFMGDSSGNVYRMEGVGLAGDAGTTDIDVSWTTKEFAAPLDTENYTIEGFLKYNKDLANTVTLTFLFGGQTAFDQVVTLTLPAVTGVQYWGDPNIYWSGDFYWGALFQDRNILQKFSVPGQSSYFQIRVEVSGVNHFNLHEIQLRDRISSQ